MLSDHWVTSAPVLLSCWSPAVAEARNSIKFLKKSLSIFSCILIWYSFIEQILFYWFQVWQQAAITNKGEHPTNFKLNRKVLAKKALERISFSLVKQMFQTLNWSKISNGIRPTVKAFLKMTGNSKPLYKISFKENIFLFWQKKNNQEIRASKIFSRSFEQKAHPFIISSSIIFLLVNDQTIVFNFLNQKYKFFKVILEFKIFQSTFLYIFDCWIMKVLIRQSVSNKIAPILEFSLKCWVNNIFNHTIKIFWKRGVICETQFLIKYICKSISLKFSGLFQELNDRSTLLICL